MVDIMKVFCNIDFDNVCVQLGDSVLTMNDLQVVSGIYRRLNLAQYILENKPENLSLCEAYRIADTIIGEADIVCTCEEDMLNTHYDDALFHFYMQHKQLTEEKGD